MEHLITPKILEEYTGNTTQVKEFTTWIETILENPHYKKRICFITGSISTGKSILVKLVLQKYNYTITEFSSSNLRIQKYRTNLYQTLRFRDVLSVFQKNNSMRKAIVIDNFENMNIATQEVYRTIKSYIIEKKTKGIPIIFIGNTKFTGRRPLGLYSVYIRLQPRNKKETICIIKHIIQKYKEQQYSTNTHIRKNANMYSMLYTKSKGDIRKIIHYLDFLVKSNTFIDMEESISQNPQKTLYSIIDYKNQYSISKIIDIVSTDLYFIDGIHNTYIQYIPYCITKDTRYNYKNNYYSMISSFSQYMSYYQVYITSNKEYNYNEYIEIAIVLVCYSIRVLLQNMKKSGEKTKIPYRSKDMWWKTVQKNTDSTIKTSLYSKVQRGLLQKSTIYTKGYKMIEKKIGKPIIWRPSSITTNLELLDIYKN